MSLQYNDNNIITNEIVKKTTALYPIWGWRGVPQSLVDTGQIWVESEGKLGYDTNFHGLSPPSFSDHDIKSFLNSI